MRYAHHPTAIRFLAANANRSLRSPGAVLCVELGQPQVGALVTSRDFAGSRFHQTALADLDEITLDKIRPTLVISPLFSSTCDAVDVAELLSLFGYTGSFWAVSPKVPNPGLVEREMSDFAYGMNFRLLMYEQPAARQA